MNNEDIKHLELLSIFHYVVGGITAFFACIPFIHVFIGLAMMFGKLPAHSKSAPPPQLFGLIFVVMGSLFILFGWCVAICMIIAGNRLKNIKNRIFCMVIAGIECCFMPFGLVLGVFTLIVLNRESVKELFDSQHLRQ